MGISSWRLNTRTMLLPITSLGNAALKRSLPRLLGTSLGRKENCPLSATSSQGGAISRMVNSRRSHPARHGSQARATSFPSSENIEFDRRLPGPFHGNNYADDFLALSLH